MIVVTSMRRDPVDHGGRERGRARARGSCLLPAAAVKQGNFSWGAAPVPRERELGAVESVATALTLLSTPATLVRAMRCALLRESGRIRALMLSDSAVDANLENLARTASQPIKNARKLREKIDNAVKSDGMKKRSGRKTGHGHPVLPVLPVLPLRPFSAQVLHSILCPSAGSARRPTTVTATASAYRCAQPRWPPGAGRWGGRSEPRPECDLSRRANGSRGGEPGKLNDKICRLMN